MAKKRLTPIEVPPAASSSDEEVASSEEEAEEAESSSGGEEETEPKKPSATPPQLKYTASTHTGASDSETESDSDSGSDSQPDHSNVKPIASKPMEDNTTATKKPQSKPSTAALKSATAPKRVSQTDREPKDSKRAKNKEKDVPSGASTEKSGDDTKKSLFQRLWSEDNEIVLLEGMIDFTEKNGISPNANVDGFLEFIKKSLGFDPTRSKLMEKMRRLKKKYKNNAGKGNKKGEEMTFSKPHEQKAYELSKKIWGGEGTSSAGVESAVKPNGKAAKKGHTGSKSTGDLTSEFPSSRQVKEETKVQVKEETKGVDSANEKNGPLLPRGNEVVKIDNGMDLTGMERFLLNKGLNFVKESKRVEFEKKWKSIKLAEMELFVRRAELIAEQAKVVLEAYRSAEN